MSKLTKKEKVRDAIITALLTVQLTSAFAAGGTILGGLTGYSNVAMADKEYAEMINATKNSISYQQFVGDVTNNAYNMYKNGRISYSEYSALVKGVDTDQAVEIYIANGGSEYPSNVVSNHYEDKKVVMDRSGRAMAIGTCAGLLAVGCTGVKHLLLKDDEEDSANVLMNE